MSGRILLPEAVLRDGSLRPGLGVHVSGGRVVAVGTPEELPDLPRRELRGSLLSPAIDLQVNGAGGRGVDEASPEALDRVAATVLEGGATAFLPTLISAPFEVLLEQVRRVARWIEGWDGTGARPLGLHVEGPFLELPGAHPPAALVDPTPERVDALLEAGGGRLSLVTLSPARPGAVEATARLTAAGARVSLGHAADPARVGACVEAGASLVTHLFNVMSPIHHREPSLALAALDDPRLVCGLIADGHHVRAEALRLAWRVLGRGRLVLVSDAASPAGAGEGEYRLGDSAVRSEGGVVRDGAGRLAGSAALLRDVVAGFRAALPEASTEDLAHLICVGPTRALGLPAELEPGAEARFALLDAAGRLSSLVA